MGACAWGLLVLLASQAAEPPSSPAPAPTDAEVVAVLPVRVQAGGQSRSLGEILEVRLAGQLSERSGWRVITTRELEEVARVEGMRQQAGCNDDGSCLAELAGAMGARRLVSSDVTGAAPVLLWTAALVDVGSGEVLQRAEVRGSDSSALFAQASEMALTLLGKADQVSLEGEAAQRRLGLGSPEALAEFRAFRVAHPQLATHEAFTAWVIEQNRESRRLALVGLLLLSAPALLFPLSAFFNMVTIQQTLEFPPTTILPLAYCASLATVGSLLGAVVLGSAGAVVTTLDALDTGRRDVDVKGCCRKDEDILDAERDERRFQRTLAPIPTVAALMGVAAGGWVLLLSLLGSAAGVWLPPQGITLSPNAGNVVEAFLLLVLVTANLFAVTGSLLLPAVTLVALAVHLVGTVVAGVVTFALAQRPLVAGLSDDGEETTP
ncbi:MAG: hypothetical protein AB2A00_12125 [Myxococcota bacterium]